MVQQIEQENTVEIQTENRNSDEEMSYNEIISDFLGEFVPGRGRIATCSVIVFLFLLLTLALWSSFGWHFYEKGPIKETGIAGEMALEMADRITKERIRLLYRKPDGTLSSAPPPWIHDDLREMIVQSPTMQNHLSIYDNFQNDMLRNALMEIYWIRKVVSIRKYYPAYVEIEVIYRRPVLLVAVASGITEDSSVAGMDSLSGGDSGTGLASEGNSDVGSVTGAASSGHLFSDTENDVKKPPLQYIPISADCRILPMDAERFPVALEDLAQFPAFAGMAPPAFSKLEKPIDITEFDGYTRPTSEVEGRSWLDETIQDVVAIVNLLGERWGRYGLDYICIEHQELSQTGMNDYSPDPKFCLVLKNGSRIHWGRRVIKRNFKNDILDTEKLEKLEKMYQQKDLIFASNQICQIKFRHQNMAEKQSPTETESVIVETDFGLQEP